MWDSYEEPPQEEYDGRQSERIPTDATNPIENNNGDDGIDIVDDTKNTTNERHSKPQKEQRDLQSGLAIATEKKIKKKKNTTTTQQRY